MSTTTSVSDVGISDVVLDLELLFNREGNNLDVDGIAYFVEDVQCTAGTVLLRIEDAAGAERLFEATLREVTR